MVSWLRLAAVGKLPACASSGRRVAVDSYWLVGAFIGSGLFMFVGGPLVRRLLQTVRRGAPD
jgi:hypothetical protein